MQSAFQRQQSSHPDPARSSTSHTDGSAARAAAVGLGAVAAGPRAWRCGALRFLLLITPKIGHTVITRDDIIARLNRDLAPHGLHQTTKQPDGTRTEGWQTFLFEGEAQLCWALPSDNGQREPNAAMYAEDENGEREFITTLWARTPDDTLARMAMLDKIHQILAPLGWTGTQTIGFNDTPLILFTAIPA